MPARYGFHADPQHPIGVVEDLNLFCNLATNLHVILLSGLVAKCFVTILRTP